MQQKLWNKNFSLIILGTIISAIGGVGLSLALSVTVYDETQSTWLTGLYSALTILPTLLLPILVSPFIDRFSRKKIIYRLDYFMGAMFLIFALITRSGYFNFYVYVAMGVVMTLNGIVYNLAYDSLFPNLIPKGMLQKGYAVGNLVYPLTNVLVLPVATLVFKHFGVSFMFVIEGILLIIAATFERYIDVDENLEGAVKLNLKAHFNDISEGFKYLLSEKGIWNVYLFFFVMMFADGLNILIYPYFEKHETLTLMHYSLLLSFQSAGYMFGGFLHYFIKIPTHLRYAISVAVYAIFAATDTLFFLMPLVAMIITKFSLGILGMNSANIRITSINAYIDDAKRGRINAVYTTMMGLSVLLGKLCTGWLGEIFTFEQVGVLYGVLVLMGIGIFIIRHRTDVRFLYNREV